MSELLSVDLVDAERAYRETFERWSGALKDAGAAGSAQQGAARKRLHLAEVQLRDAEAELAGSASAAIQRASLAPAQSSPPPSRTEWRWPINPDPPPGALAPDKVRNPDVSRVFDIFASLVDAERKFEKDTVLCTDDGVTEALRAAEVELQRWGWRPGGNAPGSPVGCRKRAQGVHCRHWWPEENADPMGWRRCTDTRARAGTCCDCGDQLHRSPEEK